MPTPPWGRGAPGAAGAVPLVFGFLLFRLAVRLYAQLGLWRTAGTLMVAVLAGWLVLLLVARLIPRAARPLLLVSLTVANLAAIGLSIWYTSPRLAPVGAQLAALASWLVLTAAVARQAAEERAFAGRGLVGAGLALVAGLLLLQPGVVLAAWGDRDLEPVGPLPPPAGDARADRPARVVLVTVDALRARSLDFAPGGRTPRLAQLAATATRFARAHAMADATLLCLPTMLSGIDVASLEATRARWEHDRLGAPPSNDLRVGLLRGLEATLAPAGYASYAATALVSPELMGLSFTDAYAFAPVSALANNFNDRPFLPLAAIGRDLTHRQALPLDYPNGIVDQLARAEGFYRRPDAHAFLWVHLGVPHSPYRQIVEGPDGKLAQAAGPLVEFDDVARADAKELVRIEGMYERQVRYLDQELGAFVARLQADPRWGRTLLVVTADHGESFHPGKQPHGSGLMDEDLTHVPLLVHLPGQARGRVVTGLASGLDVVPTLLARVYRHPPALPGLDLEGPLPADRIVASWGLYRRFLERPDRHAVAAYQGAYKYMRFYPGGTEALYDMTRGLKDVTAAHPDRLAALRAYVEGHFQLPAP